MQCFFDRHVSADSTAIVSCGNLSGKKNNSGNLIYHQSNTKENRKYAEKALNLHDHD